MRENKFQSKLIQEIKERFPGCIVLKNDANWQKAFHFRLKTIAVLRKGAQCHLSSGYAMS